MDDEPSTSDSIECHIPPELQDEIHVIAAKHPREEAKPSDLHDDQKRWLVIGICLHSVISPALRKYVDSILTVFHNELVRDYKIDTQIYPGHLKRDPQTGIFLNYEAVNNNKANYGKNIAKYDYSIQNAVDLSKLFLQTHMAHYTGFDETCDSSALLGLILNIAKFDPVIKTHADNVRKDIRNPWAHCDFSEWDAAKYSNSFQLMKTLVTDLKLGLNEKKLTIEEMEKWEINGGRFLSGTTHGLELVNEFRQETQVLAEYATVLATETTENFVKIKNELRKFETILNQIAQLDKDMKEGFSEIDKKLETQDKTQKKHDTQIEELKEDVSNCACHDSHKVDLERWKEQDIMFVATPVVKVISQVLESQQSVLLVGEPGIGKSMLMHHIALHLHNKQEYRVIPCSEIQDIRYHFKTDRRQMFVLDDICGRFMISLRDIEYLLKNEDSLKLMLEKGKSKIAATCRLDIYNDEQFHASCSLFTSNIFNLSTEYSKEDRLTICTKYLNETNIQLLKYQRKSFTPLMCYLYSKNEDFNLTDFLHSPYETYKKEWEKLQSVDLYKHCALFLCVIFNGVIEESLFDIYNENKKVLKNIFDICGINRGTSSSTMKRILDSYIGTYFRKTRNEYRVIHDQMFDFLCCYFGNKDTLVRSILHYAHIDIINERTQLESMNEQCGKFTIIISSKYEQYYFERIQHDIKRGKLKKCVCNAQMKLEKYRASLIKVLQSMDNDYLIDHPIIQDTLIIACIQGYGDIIRYLISMKVDLNKGYSGYTPLTAACNRGDEKTVQLLIDKGCDINQFDHFGATPLKVACSRENETIVQLLIDKGSDVKQVDHLGETPLKDACRRGNEKIVHLLIDKGCDVNQVKDKKQTLLTAACIGGNEMIVQLIIEQGSNVNQVDGLGETPLTVACRRENEKIVQFIVEKEGNVNQIDGNGETPLTVACKGKNEKIALLLVDKGGDVNQVNGKGETPLTAACWGGNEKIVKLLIEKGSDVIQVNCKGETPLTAACKRGNEKIVELLIEKGSDVIQVNGKGETPLTAACKKENEKIVKLLIEKGSDVNQVGGTSDTPLIAACWGGNVNIVQLLIDKGCDVNQVNETFLTPMTIACYMNNEKMVQFLINKGVDVNQVDRTGKTPLTTGCGRVNERIVQLLIEKGSEVNQVDGEGKTPLTVACGRGNEETVQCLIDKGGDINQVNGEGKTPLIVACSRGNEKIVRLLIDKGCDIYHVDGMIETPLTAACNGEHVEIVKFLLNKGCAVNQVAHFEEKPLTGARNNEFEKVAHIVTDKRYDIGQLKVVPNLCKGPRGKQQFMVDILRGYRPIPMLTACNDGNGMQIQLIMDKRSSLNHVDCVSATPLTTACKGGNVEIVHLLTDQGGDVNQIDGIGMTPLTAACKGGHEKIVQILIDNGSDINQVDGMRETPLTDACRGGYRKIVQLLIDKGGDINQVNGRGITPLEAARMMGNIDIVHLLIDKGRAVIKIDGKATKP